MSGSSIFFIFFAVIIALVGLFAAAASHDYLQVFGLGLFLFGVLSPLGGVRRHIDACDAPTH